MLGAVLLTVWALLVPQASPGAAPEAGSQAPAARGKGGLTIARGVLEETLLERYGYSETGRGLLNLLLQARLLDSLASKAKIQVSSAEVTRHWQKLDKDAKASGQSLSDEIQRRNLSPEQFREFLRLALVQEKLTRIALGRSSGKEVTGDEQQIWLQQEITTRGLETLPPSRDPDGMVARCGEVSVTRREFSHFLFERLERDELVETAWHLLLLAGIEKRMPDLSPEARQRSIEEEMARRRHKHDVAYPAITYEQRLGATGRTYDSMARDPSVAIAGLSRLWVDRSSGPEGVRSTYEKERELFEARYGEAIHAAILFRVAGRFVNDLCPRTFDQAEDELRKLATRIQSEDDFKAQVTRLTDDPNTRKKAGDLDWVTRGDSAVPREVREALFQVLETGGTIPPGRLVGPVRMNSGCALVWASERRPSPSWEEMSERVHEELRRRFLEDIMPRENVELLGARE